MNAICSRELVSFMLFLVVFACAQAVNSQMQTKVMEFNEAKSQPIKMVRIYPLEIGPDRLTVSHDITIKNIKITQAIVDMLIFPDNPKLPKSLDHAGINSGVGIHIAYESGKEFYLLALFIQGFKGEAVEYKLSEGPFVRAWDDPNLPGNHLLGHGFSHNLYEFLIDAIETSTNERPIWIRSKW